MLDLYSKQLLMKKSKSSSIELKFGDRIDNKATVVGTFESSDLGTVVFAVLDAQYRGAGIRWSSSYIGDTGLPNYPSKDLVLNAKESATYNTNYIISHYSNVSMEAFIFCRNIAPLNFNNKTYQCQLPNAYEVQQIFNNKESLDSYDITAESYPSKKLVNWGFTEGTTISFYIWTSSEWGNGIPWQVDVIDGLISKFGQTERFSVAPIIEIPLSDFDHSIIKEGNDVD